MKAPQQKTLLLFSLVAVFALLTLFSNASTFNTVVAQTGAEEPLSTPTQTVSEQPPTANYEAAFTADGLWLSSANPPAGTTIEALSPPDTNAPAAPDETQATAAIVSWRVAGPAFVPRTNGVDYAVNASGGCTYANSGSAFTAWNTPVNLPHGAVVDTVRFYYTDTRADANSILWFTVYSDYGEVVNEWSVTSSGDSGDGFSDTITINHTINYNLYSYLLNWRPVVTGLVMQMCGVRIFYEQPPFGLSFLPLIER